MRTRQQTARLASAAIISLLGLSFAPIAGAAEFNSAIALHWLNLQHLEGGADVLYAQESRSTGWVPTWGGYYDQANDLAAEASARTGILRARGQGSVRLNPICAPCSAGTQFANAEASIWDSVRILAGNGHANGDIVQVRVLAGLSGSVFLEGLPSGGSDWTFHAYFGLTLNSADLFRVDRYSGGLLPPYEATVGPLQWDQVVEVEVGQTYYLSGLLEVQAGGSGFYGFPPGVYTDVVDFYGTGSLGLGYAPGFEDLIIVSAAGATIAPAPGFSFSLNKDLTPGCKSVTGRVTLTDPAPAEGVTITLGDTLASATTPETVRVLAGAASKTFKVTTIPVAASESGTVSATLGGTTRSQNLTVRPMGLSAVKLSPSTVVGGHPSTGTATLECVAGPGPVTVDLSTSNAAVAGPVAPTVVVPQGLKSQTFAVVTNPVLSKTSAMITGEASTTTKSRQLNVVPAAVVSPTRLSFGSVPVGQTSGAMVATLRNDGVAQFAVTGINLTGTYASWFSQTNNCPANLTAGASCTISVRFTPKAVLSKTAKLSVATSATSTPISVSLSGTGI